MKFVILVLLVVACSEAQESCPGCPQEQDEYIHSEMIRPKLMEALATLNCDNQVFEIIGFEYQVVAGFKYIVTYKNGYGQTCEASWVEQRWISSQPQCVNNYCS